MPQPELDDLIDALQMAHARLLSPPRWASEDPEKLEAWEPSVQSTIDWRPLGRGTVAVCRPVSDDEEDTDGEQSDDKVDDASEDEAGYDNLTQVTTRQVARGTRLDRRKLPRLKQSGGSGNRRTNPSLSDSSDKGMSAAGLAHATRS